MKVLLLFSSLLYLSTAEDNCDCGWTNEKQTKRILIGTEAEKNEFPWMVAIIRYSVDHDGYQTSGIHCGGSIVTPWHVLTAAQCCFTPQGKSIPPGSLFFRFGAHDYKNDTSELHPVHRKIVHEQYTRDNGVYLHDIALLVTAQEIIFTKTVGRACLPKGTPSLDNQFITVMGWGLTETGQTSVLRKVNLKVLPQKRCVQAAPERYDTLTQICTYVDDNSANVCTGDSGGPLVLRNPELDGYRYTQVGIVSNPSELCGPMIAVHTNVSPYLEWIKYYVEESKSAKTCNGYDTIFNSVVSTVSTTESTTTESIYVNW